MAGVTLNTTSSVTDFLKAQGKDSSFGARKSLYETSGLADRLGAYVGSSAQNTAFLKNLQTPTSTGDTSRTPAPVSTPAPVGQDPNVNPNANYFDPGKGGNPTGTAAPVTPPTPAGSTLAEDQAKAANQGKPGFDIWGNPVSGTEPTVGSSGITASAAAGSIPQMPSADEILNSVLNSSGFQTFQQGQQLGKTLATGTAESQKAALETKTKADTKSFIDNIGRRGLYFSGETQDGIKALGESLLSSKLDIDRKLAGDLLFSDLNTQERIISEVEKVVKQAQDGRKEALAALEKVGLTVINGEVVPTLAAQAAERADAAAVRAEKNAELAAQREERLAQTAAFNQSATTARISLSEEAAARAEEYLRLAEDRAAGGGTLTSGGLTISKDAIGEAVGKLNSLRGPDGWTDPYAYLAAYQQWVDQKGLPQDFVKTFPPKLYVNPAASSIQQNGAPLLPDFLQNKPSNNVIMFSPGAVQGALDEGE